MTIRKPIFCNPLPVAALTSTTPVTGFPVTNLTRFKDIGLVWKVSGGGFVRGDFGSTKPVDFVAMLASNAASGTTIRVRLGTTQVEVDGTAPYDSGVLLWPGEASLGGVAVPAHSHLEIGSVQNARWWRIDVGHSGTFQAATIVIGQRLEPTRFYNYGFERGGKDLGKIDISRLGVVDEEPGIKLRTMDFTLGWQTEEEYETKFRPMAEAVGETSPVYLCFDPTFGAYRASKTYFGFLKNPAYARGSRKVATYEQTVSMLSLI